MFRFLKFNELFMKVHTIVQVQNNRCVGECEFVLEQSDNNSATSAQPGVMITVTVITGIESNSLPRARPRLRRTTAACAVPSLGSPPTVI